jgi:hypothetical protein
MTDDRSLERAARSWLEEGPTQAPDRAIEAAFARIQSLPQERAGALAWTLPRMRPITRLAGSAILVVLTIGVAIFALRHGSNFGAPPTPTPAGPTRPPRISTPAPVFPSAPLPDPSGEALPTELIGRTYIANPAEVQGTQQLILTLRPAADPHCAAMFEGRSTCFTYLWTPNYPKHITDPGARGSARIVDGRLVLSFDIVPFDPECVGEKATYAIGDSGGTLAGVATPACTVPAFAAMTVPPD